MYMYTNIFGQQNEKINKNRIYSNKWHEKFEKKNKKEETKVKIKIRAILANV